MVCLLLGLSLLLVGCQPKLGADGKSPDLVVRQFVESVQSKDYEKAIALLGYGDRAAIEKVKGRSFEEFCRERLEAQTYSLKFIGIDKRSRVYQFHGDDHGKQKYYRIYVFMKDGYWRVGIGT